MNDDIFREIKDQLRPSPEVRAALSAQLDAEPTVAVAPRPRRRWAWVAGAAAVAMVAGVAVGAGLTRRDSDHSDPPSLLPSAAPIPSKVQIRDASDYAPVFAAIERSLAMARENGQWTDTGAPLPAAAADGAATQAEVPGRDSYSAEGTWRTNAQVAGIDEGDIVKSDGRTIFTAAGGDVVLVDADGADTAQVARIDTTAAETGPTDGAVQGPVVDLLLQGSTLVVLVTEYTPRLSELPPSETFAYVPYDATQTRALLYDVSDPTRPRFVSSLGQSGAYVTSRLTDGIVYLVTDYTLADPEAVDAEDPATFVPQVWRGDDAAPVKATDCWLMPGPTGPRYSVLSSIDLTSGERVDTQSVLGGSDAVYMGTDALYLAGTAYQGYDAVPAELDQAIGLQRVDQTTHLVRVATDKGALDAASEGSVPGAVLNQFALDSYDGHLRIAVTMNGTTAGGGWGTYPALFVLDSSLKIVGSLSRLAVDESIQSVRFDGPVGYVVSFRQVDPLFAIDLSDPKHPMVMSALKIPGFSTYLHPWSENRLLGLGIDAGEDGIVRGMKLTMFDISDPYDVTEATTIRVPFDDAEALRNHKAVFVDAERGLIGFDATTMDAKGRQTHRYVMYRYDGKEFTLLDKLDVHQPPVDRQGGARGLSIDDFLYVVTGAGIDVYSADSLDEVTGREFGR